MTHLLGQPAQLDVNPNPETGTMPQNVSVNLNPRIKIRTQKP